MAETATSCRLCSGNCGVVATHDDAGRISRLRGNRASPFSKGFACGKGLDAFLSMYAPDRLLHPMKRMADGTFQAIGLDQALDEIAARLRVILDEQGPRAVAAFNGTAHYCNSVLVQMIEDWLAAIGSVNRYSTVTVDQSSHMVTAGRMGSWNAGRHRLDGSDVAMMVGSNPLVSLGAYFLLSSDPMKRLKAAKARGLKLIVVDPRRTETAEHADCFVQLRPGEDPAVIGGMLRIILANGWEDRAFCDAHVEGLEALKEAVAPFDPAFVTARAGVPEQTLLQAAEMFARDGSRGPAITGTGGAMAPQSNLTDHLVEALNVVCGRFHRAGERVAHPGVLAPPRPFHAEAIAPDRTWERAPFNLTGHGLIAGEFPSGVLADQILSDHPQRLRALFVNGGNPAMCLPDQRKTIAALGRLDLLVTIDPFLSATARLAHYVIPPKMMYEREDFLFGPRLETVQCDVPYAQHLAPLSPAPVGADLVDDWEVYRGLADRLGLDLRFAGERLEPGRPLATRDMLEILLRGSRVPLDTIKQYPDGHIFDEDLPIVQPARAESSARLSVMPADVAAEMLDYLHRPSSAAPYALIVRRERHLMNSMPGHGPRERIASENPLYMNPVDLADLDLAPGARIRIASTAGEIEAHAAADATLPSGIVAMTHCRGGLPSDDAASVSPGVAVARLVSTETMVEPVNAMPAMTAIPVSIVAAADRSHALSSLSDTRAHPVTILADAPQGV